MPRKPSERSEFIPTARSLLSSLVARVRTALPGASEEAPAAGEIDRQQAPAASPPGGSAAPAPDGAAPETPPSIAGSAMEADRDEAGRIWMHWNIGPTWLAHTRSRVLAGGDLTARLIVFEPAEDDLVRKRTTDRRVGPSGEWMVSDVHPQAHCACAVGWRAGDRFVSVVHGPTLAPPRN